jgi:hypothetical protein
MRMPDRPNFPQVGRSTQDENVVPADALIGGSRFDFELAMLVAAH